MEIQNIIVMFIKVYDAGEEITPEIIKGVEGIYDGYYYFEERKLALKALSNLLVQLESGTSEKIIPIKRTQIKKL